MNILVVGGGGREHAIIKKLRENSEVEKIYALPGNGGIARDAECVPVKATDIEGIVEFAKKIHPDYAVVAPDDPLVMGCVDALTNIGIPCFGPEAKAAVIEGSKVFSKNLMKKYGIPTARYQTFEDMDDALYYLESAPIPTVIKADGLHTFRRHLDRVHMFNKKDLLHTLAIIACVATSNVYQRQFISLVQKLLTEARHVCMVGRFRLVVKGA